MLRLQRLVFVSLAATTLSTLTFGAETTSAPAVPGQADYEKGMEAVKSNDIAKALPLFLKAAEVGHRRAT